MVLTNRISLICENCLHNILEMTQSVKIVPRKFGAIWYCVILTPPPWIMKTLAFNVLPIHSPFYEIYPL